MTNFPDVEKVCKRLLSKVCFSFGTWMWKRGTSPSAADNGEAAALLRTLSAEISEIEGEKGLLKTQLHARIAELEAENEALKHEIEQWKIEADRGRDIIDDLQRLSEDLGRSKI